MQTELVIFDCDGVLVDSEKLSNRVLVEFVAEFGLALEVEEAILLFKGCKMAVEASGVHVFHSMYQLPFLLSQHSQKVGIGLNKKNNGKLVVL